MLVGQVRQRLGWKTFAGYLAASLVLVVGIVGYVSLGRIRQLRIGVERSHALLAANKDLMIALLDAESGTRGFLVTGEENYAEPYRVARAKVAVAFAELERLSNDDPTVLRRLADMRRLADRKLIELDESMRLRQLVSDDASDRFVGTNIGKDLMDTLRTHAAQLAESESLVAAARSRQRADLQAAAEAVLTFGTIVAFLLVAWVTTWILRGMADSERDRATITTQAEQLEVTNAALARTNRELDQFAYVASHDLRAPLRGIASLADWIEEDFSGEAGPDVKRHFEQLRRRVQRLEALIDGLLNFARAGRNDGKVEAIELRALVSSLVELLSPKTGIRVVIDGNFPTVMAERIPLEQVLINLLGNAIKHGCKNGGTIRVEAKLRAQERMVELSVADDGPGVPERYHQRIFELFQTLESRDRVEGAGIGLALVKKHVEQRGGRIWVDTDVARGARFVMWWPQFANEGFRESRQQSLSA